MIPIWNLFWLFLTRQFKLHDNEEKDKASLFKTMPNIKKFLEVYNEELQVL